MLAHAEAMELLRRAQAGDEEAANRLAEENLALVRSVVKRFLGRGTEYEDLYQIGCLGLVKAIRHFNPDFGVQFSTYAVPMISGEIKRFLRDDGPVKVGRSLKELAAQALGVRERIASERGASPGIVEIAAELGVSPEDVALSLDAVRPTVSLNERLYDEDDGATKEDLLPDPAVEETMVDRILIKELLGTLDVRERQIIMLRYFRDCTQSQVAARLGVSQVQISRLESKILKKMRALTHPDTE